MKQVTTEFMKHYSLEQWLIDQIKFNESIDQGANIQCVPYYKKCLDLLLETKSGQE